MTPRTAQLYAAGSGTAAGGPDSSKGSRQQPPALLDGPGTLARPRPFPGPARLIVFPAFQRGRKRGGRLRRPGPWARRFRHSCLFPCPPLRQPSLTHPASARVPLAVAGGSIGACQAGVSASRSLLPSSLTPRPAISAGPGRSPSPVPGLSFPGSGTPGRSLRCRRPVPRP